jgi:hypothetical protein
MLYMYFKYLHTPKRLCLCGGTHRLYYLRSMFLATVDVPFDYPLYMWTRLIVLTFRPPTEYYIT